MPNNAGVLRILASGLVAAGVLATGVVGGAAPAQASPMVDKGDRHGDVEVVGDTQGIDPAVLDSVDLRHVTVTRQRGNVRVVVRLKEVLPAGRWFQQVGLSVVPPGGWAAPPWLFLVSATPQHLGSAGAIYVEIGEEEDGPDDEGNELFCRVVASKGEHVVRLEIPDRCLPPGPGKLVVGAVLLDKRGDGLPVAQDELGVGGLVDLRSSR
jgi:hypothetical protein